jgi:eukaryotic-like serine/threonine-protein kinase
MATGPGNSCPECGSALAPGALEGLCLRCLVKAGASFRGRKLAETPTPDRLFGDYEIGREIGRGGMSRVYRARQVSLDRTVAIKILAGGRWARHEDLERFRIEAEAAAGLDHPNIVPIYEVGEHEGCSFLSMRLVHGPTLAGMVRFQKPSYEQAARILAQVARAIHHAHERGILHRDLKPANILLDSDGEPHITDFGLAKFTGRDSNLTETDMAMGTPAYMAPEQASAETRTVTTAVDVYGLGATLYEALAGQPPFTGPSPIAIVQQVLDTDPRPLSSIDRRIPPDLSIICRKCLNKEPAARYTTALAVAEDLERWLNHEPITARAAPPIEVAWKWVRRNPIHAVLLATVALGAIGAIAGLTWHGRRLSAQKDVTEIANRSLSRKLREIEWRDAETRVEAGQTPEAMALFARFLRETPGDLTAAHRLMSLLEHRAFPLPVSPSLPHGEPLKQVRFDPSGKRVATLATDRRLRVWDFRAGRILHEVPDIVANSSLHWASDGRRLVAVSTRYEAVEIDIERRTRPRRIAPAPHPNHLQISRDARYVAAMGEDRGLELWDAASATLVARTHLPANAMFIADALGPDEEIVAGAEHLGLWLWRPRTGDVRRLAGPKVDCIAAVVDWPRHRAYASLEPQGNGGRPSGVAAIDLDTGEELNFQPGWAWQTVAIDASGSRLAASRWNVGVYALDTATMKLRFDPVAAAPIQPQLSTDRALRTAFTAMPDGSGRLIDLDGGRILQEPVRHVGLIASHQLTADGALLATGSQDGTARVWDTRMRVAEPPLADLKTWVHGMALSPDGTALALTGPSGTELFQPETGEALRVRLPSGDAFKPAFSRDGQRLIVASGDGTVQVWDRMTGARIGTGTRHDRRVWVAQFSPDATLAVTGGEDGTCRVFEVASGQLRYSELRHGGDITDAGFSPDGRWIASSSTDATAQVWDAATGKPAGPALRHMGTVWSVKFAPDGRHVLTASGDRTAQLWDFVSGRRVGPAIEGDVGILAARFSPDGRRIAIGTLNGARVFDAATARPISQPMSHRNRVWYALFSPDGEKLATASEDGTARIWDAASGFPLTEPLIHAGALSGLVWTADGQRILTCDVRGTVRMTRLPGLESAPTWLPALAETLAGHVPVAPAQGVSGTGLEEFQRLARAANASTPSLQWLRWFLFERVPLGESQP